MKSKKSASLSTVSAEQFEKTGTKVTAVSMAGNLILSALKLAAGLIAKSGAMISDAVQSVSDVLSGIIVLVGVKLSAKNSDKEHPYGHERLECVAAIVLAVVLFITALFIGENAVEKIVAGDYAALPVPGVLALVAAAVSIAVKEGLYWYTRYHAKKISSTALMGVAWDHRSDVLSTSCVLAGVVGARLGVPVLDVVASIVVCLFIVKAAVGIFKEAVEKMVDKSCDEQTEGEIAACALRQDGVLGVDLIQTRVFGSRVYVDIEIAADGAISLEQGHEIAERVHDAIEGEFSFVKHIMVHVNPAQGGEKAD
jgi:cation diffusion facilitator family transporter